jgi:uncharacterized protein
MSSLTARDIIAMFAMEPHPTAGWFAPHYSDTEIWGRAKISSIYYLLPAQMPMPLHKSDATEIWNYHLGAPCEFVVTNGGRMQVTSVLGGDLVAGQRPQIAVPAWLTQSCRSLGDWTLLGCTAAPGFSPRPAYLMDTEA